jgi:hypothetical protein
MKKIKHYIMAVLMVLGVGMAVMPLTANAYNPFQNTCDGSTDSSLCNNQDSKFSDFIATIVNTLLFIIGTVAVITIIIAGIRYTTSHGDPKGVQVAKDTMFYAIIGLVVAISAYAIVNFVIFKFFVK